MTARTLIIRKPYTTDTYSQEDTWCTTDSYHKYLLALRYSRAWQDMVIR